MTAIGSLGDVLPILGFGRAIRDRGHSVAVITTGGFRADVERAGLEYVEIFDQPQYELIIREMERIVAEKKRLSTMDSQALTLLESLPERQYRLVETHRVVGDTVFTTQPFSSFGVTRLLDEALGVPSAFTWINVREFRAVQPALPGALRPLEDGAKNAFVGCFAGPMRGCYDQVRAQLGLPADRNFIRAWWYSQQLNIGLFPSWFVPWFKGKLPNTVLTDFPRYRREPDGQLPAELEAFLQRGSAPIVFGNASWRRDVDEYFAASIAACRTLGRRGVILSERAQNLPALGEDVFAIGYADMELLLPRAAAVVNHGGMGSIASALGAGTPQLAVPWINDQPFNARAMQDLGAGLAVAPKRYTKDAAGALRKLLESEEIRAACEQVAARFAGGPDFSTAITRLERLIR